MQDFLTIIVWPPLYSCDGYSIPDFVFEIKTDATPWEFLWKIDMHGIVLNIAENHLVCNEICKKVFVFRKYMLASMDIWYYNVLVLI